MSLQVTTLEQLKNIKTTEVIEVGNFDDGTPLVAEVKRPNLLNLITTGAMPNTLLKPAMKMFNGKGSEIMNKVDNDEIGALKELGGILDILAEECLVNPSLEDIHSCGLDLNMDQKMAVLMYSQGGIKQLEGFRLQQAHNASNQAVNEVQPTAEPNPGN